MTVTRDLLVQHVEAYFASTEEERAAVYRLIDDAWRISGDVVSDAIPGGAWRHAWPEVARAAALAIWGTPRVPGTHPRR